MLKGIPSVISPELMSVMMSMGHGDEIVLADGNFPADSHAQRIVRADGLEGIPLLQAMLQFLPLDTFVDHPAMVMQPVAANQSDLQSGDFIENTPPIWTQFARLIEQAEQREVRLHPLERFEFYQRAESAYAIVATSETALYANLILKKGVVSPTE